MTDVVGRSALEELRKFPGFEEAIIAGGFCRDSALGGKIKDLDIFVPCTDIDDFYDMVWDQFPVKEFDYSSVLDKKFSKLDFNKMVTDWEKKHDGSSWFNHFDIRVNDEGTEYWGVFRKHSFPAKRLVTPSLGNFKDLKWSQPLRMSDDDGYGKALSKVYSGRFDCQYMGFLDCDIIGYDITDKPKDMEFSEWVTSDFNFGLDKIFYDGETTVKSREFERDERFHEATLLKLKSIEALPRAIEKFNRLKEKYPKLMFRSTCLEIKDSKKQQEDEEREEDRFRKEVHFDDNF